MFKRIGISAAFALLTAASLSVIWELVSKLASLAKLYSAGTDWEWFAPSSGFLALFIAAMVGYFVVLSKP